MSAVGYVLIVNNPFKEKEVIMPLTKSWEKVVPNQEVPAGLVDLSAENCGVCQRTLRRMAILHAFARLDGCPISSRIT